MSYMNPSNAYWAPPQYKQSFMKPVSGHVGFLLNLPYPDPIMTPTTGEGNQNIYGKRELVFATLPESFAVGDILPTTGGIPRLDPNSLAGKYSRLDYTTRV